MSITLPRLIEHMPDMEMDKENLHIAIKSLNIYSVLLVSTTTERRRSSIPLEYNDSMQFQSFSGVKSCELDKADDVPEDDDIYKYRYTYLFSSGVRVVDIDEDSSDDEQEIHAQIEASYEAVYLSAKKLDDKCINEFGKNNVQFHVWPYWREFVQSSCQRLGIELITIPLYKPHSIKETAEITDQT